MRQEQDGGNGSTNNQAARDIHVHHHHYGVTEARFQELARNLEDQAMELGMNNAPRLAREANGMYDNRAIKMTTEVITKTVTVDPELLDRFKNPRAQIALVKAQEAYGETGDDELGAILAGLVVALVAAPTRTREAIECARPSNARRALPPNTLTLSS